MSNIKKTERKLLHVCPYCLFMVHHYHRRKRIIFEGKYRHAHRNCYKRANGQLPQTDGNQLQGV